MGKSKDNVIKEFIIGTGFLSGLWFAIGISPSQAVINVIQPYLENIHPYVKIAFFIVPILITIFTIIKIYARGGLVGGIAVFLAFLSGTLIFKLPTATITLFIAAVILGFVSFRK